MIKSPRTKRQNPPLKNENKLSLPFIEKYKDKITRISKEGPIKQNDIGLPSLKQSKATSKETI